MSPTIAGIDEAGRGALAGPVVAGACVLTHPLFRRRKPRKSWSPFERAAAARRAHGSDCLIADSKQLTPSLRETAFMWITSHALWGVGIVPAEEIEEIGILAATERAMNAAIADLAARVLPEHLLVDGRDRFAFPYPHTSVVRGDATEPCIAAASIIAKVTRDRIMVQEAERHPHHDFSRHKGYGTPEHIRSLLTHGPCELHRRSFLGRVLAAPRARPRPRKWERSAVDRA